MPRAVVDGPLSIDTHYKCTPLQTERAKRWLGPEVLAKYKKMRRQNFFLRFGDYYAAAKNIFPAAKTRKPRHPVNYHADPTRDRRRPMTLGSAIDFFVSQPWASIERILGLEREVRHTWNRPMWSREDGEEDDDDEGQWAAAVNFQDMTCPPTPMTDVLEHIARATFEQDVYDARCQKDKEHMVSVCWRFDPYGDVLDAVKEYAARNTNWYSNFEALAARSDTHGGMAVAASDMIERLKEDLVAIEWDPQPPCCREYVETVRKGIFVLLDRWFSDVQFMTSRFCGRKKIAWATPRESGRPAGNLWEFQLDEDEDEVEGSMVVDVDVDEVEDSMDVDVYE